MSKFKDKQKYESLLFRPRRLDMYMSRTCAKEAEQTLRIALSLSVSLSLLEYCTDTNIHLCLYYGDSQQHNIE